MTLRFAFLVLEGHPYGREMLRILLERGLSPSLIVEETSPVADEERAKFLTRIAGQPVPPTFDEILDGYDIPRLKVTNLNGADCRTLIASAAPDMLVLGGTGIIRMPVLALAPRGTLNAHPGLLPRLRGSASVAWALFRDLPVGSTVHLVDEGIDTGPIVLRRYLPVHRGDTYEQIVRRVLTLSGTLMAEALALFELGEVKVLSQDPRAGETLGVIPDEYLQDVRARLALGRYSHFTD